jgi:hypothetical protein
MNIGHFVNRPVKNSSIFLALCLVSFVVFVARGYSQSPCINQSPRDLTLNRSAHGEPPVLGLDYNYRSGTPLVVPVDRTTVQYQGHTLHICDQHYHVPVENWQGCKNEKDGLPPAHGTPPVNQWIEVHTVYALEVDSAAGCADGPDRNLACCKKPPFVVRGFSAKVTSPIPSPPPITQPTTGLLAEWSGSNTSPDEKPGGCKPLPAQWSFRFGCEFTVSQSQLEDHLHAHGARPVQPPNRVSPDLTIVGPASEVDVTCRDVRTTPIPDEAMAQKWACPATCKEPLNSFSGKWTNVPHTGDPQYAVCNCCPLPRPQ